MSAAQRDFSRLAGWLGAHTDLGGACRITGVGQPKTGFSADTVMLTVDPGASAPREIVVRIMNPERNIFLDAAIERQAKMMRGLRRHGVETPAVLGWDDDAAILGAPFLVMDRCEGAVLPQFPSYHVAGLLLDLDVEGRNRAWREALETIAQINRIDWRADFGFLLEPRYGEPGLDHYLGWIAAWRAVACGEAHPVIDPAIDHLTNNRPANTRAELLWGDSNPGNFLFAADGAVAAALDFEAASIGPAEIDLAWWFVLDRMLAAGQPLPAGMPDRDAQIRIYEQALGRAVGDLDYFEVVAALRMSLVIAQTCRILVKAGRLPPDNRAGEFNPAVSMLAGMIGVDHDPQLTDYMEFVTVMNER